MEITQTGIEGLLIFEPTIFKDSRGYFFEAYNTMALQKNGINIPFLQDNQSMSNYGVIRGLHYQIAPYQQTKLVRVLKGEVFDVAVDIRTNSVTYGQSFGIILSDSNMKQLLIPAGFAHGFSVLSDEAVVMYKCDQYYHKASERGIVYNDKTLNIDWMIPAEKAIVSEKDMILPSFNDIF